MVNYPTRNLYFVIPKRVFRLTFAVDITVYHRGFHGDLNETFLVGEVSPDAKKLVQNTWECLQKSIEMGITLFGNLSAIEY